MSLSDSLFSCMLSRGSKETVNCLLPTVDGFHESEISIMSPLSKL